MKNHITAFKNASLLASLLFSNRSFFYSMVSTDGGFNFSNKT